ncbi:MAG: BrnT family toxin, partial [Bdellovibrionota bacterium]
NNQRKHGISFEEAQSIFYDPNARITSDPEHYDAEERYVLLGVSERFRILTVVHCYRKNESVIRIISARKATRKEQKYYEEHLP